MNNARVGPRLGRLPHRGAGRGHELAERSGGDNDAGEWGVMLGSDEACMIYGTPAELRRLLLQAHNALPAADRYEGLPFDGIGRPPRRSPLT
jgi:hypothetical protein